ncbi:hypothetical protein U1Q18_005727 [Sarracenia purpurea var. burkii]
MVEECRDCRKWEEDMYWSHFQSIMFCQLLSQDFDQQLAIPKKFANNLKEKLPENVTLKGPSGAKWNVGLVTSGDTMLFEHGWKEFVDDHSLKEDDVLIFKYNGDSRFDVLIFDGRSLCEREASYFVRKCGHTEIDGAFRPKRSMGESSVEVMRECSHYAMGCTPSNKTRIADNLIPVESGRHDQANRTIKKGVNQSRARRAKLGSREPSPDVVAQNVNSEAKKGSVAAYPLKYVSNRRPVTEEEKEKALQMAHAASTEDSFIVVMRPSHVYKGFYMSIPSEWATSHLPHKNQDVILRVKENTTVKEKTWNARFCFKGHGGGLTGGWRSFAVENNLEEFDACLFALASGTDDAAVVMNVSVFRVVGEASPLTRATSSSPPRRGKPSKYPRRK